MRTLIISTAMAALVVSQALAQTPPSPPTPIAEPLRPELIPDSAPARPVQIAALGNPPASPPEPPLAAAPAIRPAPLAAPVASDGAQDASAREPILDLTATPD